MVTVQEITQEQDATLRDAIDSWKTTIDELEQDVDQFEEATGVDLVAPTPNIATPDEPIKTVNIEEEAWSQLLTDWLSPDEIESRKIGILRKDKWDVTKEEREFLRETRLLEKEPEESPLEKQLKQKEREFSQLERELNLQAAKAEAKKFEEVQAKTLRARRKEKEAGKKRLDSVQTIYSFSGFGRSTAAAEKRDEIQQSINSQINALEKAAEAEQELFNMQLEGAKQEALKAKRTELDNLKAVAKWFENKSIQIAQDLNADSNLSIDQQLDAFLATMGDVPVEVDKDVSKLTWYLSDKFGNPLQLDENWNPIPFTRGEGATIPNITTVKDANDNIYIYKNGQLDQIIQSDWKIVDGKNVTEVPSSVKEKKRDKELIDIETNLRKEYNGLQDVKQFRDVRSSFSRVQSASQLAETWSDEQKAASDIAMVFAFMKMLDPGSVVREGEFANAQNATGVPGQITNVYNKLLYGGRLNPTQRASFLKQAQDIFNREQGNINDINDRYRSIANEYGVRPEFVIEGDDFDFQTPPEVDLEDDESISSFLDSPGGFSAAGTTAISTDPLDVIRREEGFREEAYLDPAWIPTIGYGFTSIDWRRVQMGDSMTKEAAEKELQKQIWSRQRFRDSVTVPLSPEQATALTSFEYNLWSGIWQTTGKAIIEAINNNDFEEAARIMKLHNKARNPQTGQLETLRGLVNRRNREAELLIG